MATFDCAVPFLAGETWRRWNFFSLDMNAIGESPRVTSLRSTGALAVKQCEAIKTTSKSGWGAETPVIEIYILLETTAEQPGTVVVTIDVELEGELVACAKAAGACESGTSG